MIRFKYILTSLAILVIITVATHPSALWAQEGSKRIVLRTPLTIDSLVSGILIEGIEVNETTKLKQVYDSIDARIERKSFLYDMLFKDGSGPDNSEEQRRIIKSKARDATDIYEQFNGKTIEEIRIFRSTIYTSPEGYFKKNANLSHMLTRERTIKYDLLFKIGDTVDPRAIVFTRQQLLSRGYLSDVLITIVENPNNPELVTVYINTRDKFAFGFDLSLKGDSRASLGLYDANFLGTGTKLRVGTNFNWKKFKYGGNSISYSVPNILGSFLTAYLYAGRNFETKRYSALIERSFISPTDYMVGGRFDNDTKFIYRKDIDSSNLISYGGFDLWLGGAKEIKKIKSSIFLVGRYYHRDYRDRPTETNMFYNPRFHDQNMLIFSAGAYQERFYVANLLYGFGNTEFLAKGYKAELLYGYAWGEYGRNHYIGGKLEVGDFTKLGYLVGEIEVGGYLDPGFKNPSRNVFHAEIRWFSDLYKHKKGAVRQFGSISYTRGWNRFGGSNEVMQFTKDDGPVTLKEPGLIGNNRFVINTEGVLFTKFIPLGFRIAFFHFLDVGLIGNNINIFKNDFATTLGFGVRLKNERFVLSLLDIRIGVAFGKNGLLRNSIIKVNTSEQRTERNRFVPYYPSPIEYE